MRYLNLMKDNGTFCALLILWLAKDHLLFALIILFVFLCFYFHISNHATPKTLTITAICV